MLSVPLQDFETNNELKTKVIAFLEEVMHDPELLTQERKAAANIIRYCCVPFDCATMLICYVKAAFENMCFTAHTSGLELLFYCLAGL